MCIMFTYEVSENVRCVFCNCTQSRVIDSRQNEDGTTIRRRRECENCGRRFTTYERIERVPMRVVKKDQRREAFDAEKLRVGIVRACEKRPVAIKDIDKLVRDVEQAVYGCGEAEVSSQFIGEKVMNGLKKLDEVAYVRFASVYRQFKDIFTFMDELNKLLIDAETGATDGQPSAR